MENAVDIFRFEEHEVRTHIDEKGELWFVAKDVAEILEYKAWDSNLVGHIPVEWKGAKRIRTLGGAQSMLAVSEFGLYELVTSRLEQGDTNTIILNEGIPGNPNTTIISESGLYELVTGSRETFQQRGESC